MGLQATAMAASCGYYTTGTCEFLVGKDLDFYFLEMNTRLQVEHPITEEITGVDLVEEMITIAAGHPLSMTQDDIKIKRHSIEMRVYAEDSSRKFLPSIGFLRKYQEPPAHPDIRIDTGVEEGSEISMYYDPMIAKLITTGDDRTAALALMNDALDNYVIQGVTDNLGFGKSVINNPDFVKGDYDTGFIEKFYPEGYHGEPLTPKDHMVLALTAAQVKNRAQILNATAGTEPLIWESVIAVIEKTPYRVELGAEEGSF